MGGSDRVGHREVRTGSGRRALHRFPAARNDPAATDTGTETAVQTASTRSRFIGHRLPRSDTSEPWPEVTIFDMVTGG
jgi:hypothetical protein